MSASAVKTSFPGRFSSGSAYHRPGDGVVMRYFGFNNEAQVRQIRVKLANEDFENILTLDYDVDAA